MNPSSIRELLSHQDIVYRIPGTRWEEALPMGDGCFGAMMCQEGNAFQWALNHLDLYLAFNPTDFPVPNHHDRRKIARQAWEARRDPSHPAAQNYNHILFPGEFKNYGWLRRGVRMNLAGQLEIEPSLPPAEATFFEQRLNLHDAAVTARCRWGKRELRLRSFVARSHHTLVIQVEGSTPRMIERLRLRRPVPRVSHAPTAGFRDGDFWLADCMGPPYAQWSGQIGYALCGCVLDERGERISTLEVSRTARAIELQLPTQARRFTILLTVAVEKQADRAVDGARRVILQSRQRGVHELERTHRQHWHAFWGKSQIELADRFLEKLWYVNLYALAASNGAGTREKAQAAGLNGLWDIRNPNGWGSSWFWDVNIQETYWSCYTANHPELAQPFYTGLREYVPAARRWAREFYKMRGIAADFPFPFFHCVWPWCCQLLWWGYRYSMDEAFLRDTAYPVMREVLFFFEDFLRRDAQGRLTAFPSVSPEQGPLGTNPTILLGALRHLLRAGIAASTRLRVDAAHRRAWRRILGRLAPFSTGTSAAFGETLLDSEWASPTLSLAHPGLLMPIYPAAEIGPDSSARLRRVARNTLTYVENRQSLGTFNFAWLCGAASRFSLGNEALRIVYEKGVAHLLRPNGLMAEQTDRFIHNCHVLADPLYHPPMVECCGGLVGVVNEMLLQSRDGKIRVFPAVPSSWAHARFDRLLAEGAWEISAEWWGGKTAWVEVRSLKGGACRLVVDGKAFTFHLEAGQVRRLSLTRPSLRAVMPVRRDSALPCYVTPTHRRVFLGKDAESEYLRKLDHFLFDYHLGDLPVPRATKYKFDFGPAPAVPKDYACVIPQQLFNGNKIGPDFYRIHPGTQYTDVLRHGWEKTGALRAMDRRHPDALRRDFVAGRGSTAFCVELPRGQYQLLILMGDMKAETHAEVEMEDQFHWQAPHALRAGEFALEVFPIRMTEDAVLKIRFRGSRRHAWKLNILMINQVP